MPFLSLVWFVTRVLGWPQLQLLNCVINSLYVDMITTTVSQLSGVPQQAQQAAVGHVDDPPRQEAPRVVHVDTTEHATNASLFQQLNENWAKTSKLPS